VGPVYNKCPQKHGAAIAAEEEKATEERRKTGIPIRTIKDQSPFETPATSEERFGINPRVAAKSKWARIAALQRNARFLARYREAFEARRRGDVDVVFPHDSLRSMDGAAGGPRKLSPLAPLATSFPTVGGLAGRRGVGGHALGTAPRALAGSRYRCAIAEPREEPSTPPRADRCRLSCMRHVWGAALLVSASSACGGEVVLSAGGGGPGGVGGGAAGGSGAGGDEARCEIPLPSSYQKTNREVGICPELTASCDDGPFAHPPLFTAAQLDADSLFVAASGGLVLAERPRGDGTFEPIVAGASPDGDLTNLVQIPFEAAPHQAMRARDLHGNHLLLCGGGDCRIYVVRHIGDPQVQELPGGQIPAGVMQVTLGLTTFGAGLPCVFGDGVHCLDDGHWIELVASGSGPSFNAAAGAPTAIWAAGDEGRLVVASPSCVIELPSGTSEALRAVSADGARELWGTAVGDGGVVVHASLEETTTCKLGGSWSVLHRTWGNNWGYGVAHEHDVMWLFEVSGLGIRGKPAAGGEWCTHDLGEEIVDITVFSCGIAENPWIVTPTAIYGSDHCAID
jgi:hypothetical protein